MNFTTTLDLVQVVGVQCVSVVKPEIPSYIHKQLCFSLKSVIE
jgi:hypothetical protein